VFGAAASEPGLDRLVTEFVTELAFHVVNLAISVNPARIAVGGGLVRSWERLRPGLEEALKAGTPFPPELVPARFPDDAPLIGAVALAADAAGADISASHTGASHTGAVQAGTGRAETARADGAIDGAPVIHPSQSLTERLQS
jgi:hypothetical protein